MRTRTRIILPAAAVAALVLPACGGLSADTAAIVNGERIEVGDVEILVAAQLPEGSSVLGRPGPDEFREVDQLQRQTLGQLIQDALVGGAAAELGVEPSEAAIDEEFAGLAEQYGGEEELRAEIARRSLRVQDVRRQISNLLRRDLLNDHFTEQVTDEQLREEYEARVDEEFRVAEAAHILVESEEEALDLMEQLREGADFGELATEHSQDAVSAANGGDLGARPRGQYVQEFDDALWNAEAGDLVGPVQTQFGWHIIQAKDFRERPLDEVAEQLRQEIGGRGFRDWFQALLRDSEVRVSSRFGSWDATNGTVVPGGPLEPGRPAAPPTPVS